MDEDIISKELEKFTVTNSNIAEIKQKYSGLVINGIDDKEGYKAVSDARKFVKSKRVEVEKKRKELKEDSLRFGRAVDAEARRITGELSPIENRLSQTQKSIDDELAAIKKKKADDERIKREHEEKAKLDKAQSRINELLNVGYSDLTIIEAMSISDENFDKILRSETKKYIQSQIEKKKIKEEEERVLKIRLEKEAKLEEENRALKEKQDKANLLIEERNAALTVVREIETDETDCCFVDAFGSENNADSVLYVPSDNIEIKQSEIEYEIKLTISEIDIISEFLTDAIREYSQDPLSHEYENILLKFTEAAKNE